MTTYNIHVALYMDFKLGFLLFFDKRRRVEYLDLGNRNNQKDGDNYIKCF